MSARLHDDHKPGDYMCEHCYTHFRHSVGDLVCQQCGNCDRASLLPIECPKNVEAEDLQAIEEIVSMNGSESAASGNFQETR